MIRTIVFLAWVASGLVVACGKTETARTPSGGKISCESDSDCVVVNHTGCCACCDGPAVAVPKKEQARVESQCASAACQPCSPSIACAKVEPTSAFGAKCTDGTCAAVHN